MREIKFRAWDKEARTMTYKVDFINTARNYPLMQYTGLKDKNGKEIWEGDLIKAGQMIYQISWYAMEGRLQPFTTEQITTNQYIASSGVPIRDWNWLDGGKAINYHSLKKRVEVEVIGNIWENPELLEVSA